MIFLLLAILMSVGIFTAFRIFTALKAVTFHAIVVNYWVCVITGLIYVGPARVAEAWAWDAPWLPFAGILGVLFITTFYLMALTTQRVSMSVASIANKMSLVVPVLVSFFILEAQTKTYDGWNISGIVLAFPALWLSSMPARNRQTVAQAVDQPFWKNLWLPLAVFFMGGIIDSVFNYTSYHYISDELSPIITVILFAIAGGLGTLVLLVRRQMPSWRSILSGVILGVPNFFSIYYMLKALGAFNNDGALMYPLFNLGIIVGSTLVGVLVFREKLSRANYLGIGLALLAMVLLSYQELLTAW